MTENIETNTTTETNIHNDLDVIVSEDNIANVHVSFELAELLPYQKRYIEEKRKHVILRGYRKGTAPESMVAKFFAEEAKEAAKNNLLFVKYSKLLQDHKLQPLNQPKLDKFVSGDNSISAEFSVEVLQPITLTQYLGLSLQKMPSISTDVALENMLKNIRHSYPKLIATAEAATNGKVAVTSFTMTVDGSEFEQQKDLKVLLGSNLYYQAFEENLIGLKTGDKKEFDVVFPETYQRDELKGKTAHFSVSVTEVNEVTEYNADELASILNYADKNVMLDAMRNEIETKNKEEERLFYENQILGQLLSTHQFKLPKTLLENEIKRISAEKPEMSQEQVIEVAERFVRTDLILNAIYERHPDIHLTDENFRSNIDELAKRAKDSVENVVKKLQDTNKMQSYFNYLKNCRVIDFLIETAEKEESVNIADNVTGENNG